MGGSFPVDFQMISLFYLSSFQLNFKTASYVRSGACSMVKIVRFAAGATQWPRHDVQHKSD